MLWESVSTYNTKFLCGSLRMTRRHFVAWLLVAFACEIIRACEKELRIPSYIHSTVASTSRSCTEVFSGFTLAYKKQYPDVSHNDKISKRSTNVRGRWSGGHSMRCIACWSCAKPFTIYTLNEVQWVAFLLQLENLVSYFFVSFYCNPFVDPRKNRGAFSCYINLSNLCGSIRSSYFSGARWNNITAERGAFDVHHRVHGSDG